MFVGYFHPETVFQIMKINNFRGELTDILAKMEALMKALVATQLTLSSLLQDFVGVEVVCGNSLCESGESESCLTDCILQRACPMPTSSQVGSLQACGGNGACVTLYGLCQCNVGTFSSCHVDTRT